MIFSEEEYIKIAELATQGKVVTDSVNIDETGFPYEFSCKIRNLYTGDTHEFNAYGIQSIDYPQSINVLNILKYFEQR